MNKAFTMIELVFVIIVIGILSATIIPRIQTNHNAETAINLVSQIRYTQHLALVDDNYDATTSDWYKKRWSIIFNGTSYSILKNGVYAKDPQTQQDINSVDLKINSITFGGGCAGGNIISFDHLGRPLVGDLTALTSPYSNNILLQTPCSIVLTNQGDDNETLTLSPETGYIRR